MNRSRLVFLTAAAVALVALPASGGSLVIAGGGLSPQDGEIYGAILERALPRRPVCILATAHAEPARGLSFFARTFERHAPRQARGDSPIVLQVPLTVDSLDASNPAVVGTLARCGGFFFTGGDPTRVMRVLEPQGRRTVGATLLHRMLATGGVIAGIGTGGAMVSDPMIAGGGSEEALEHGVTREPGGEGVVLQPGMGFWPGVQVDSHALESGRLGRLLVVTGEVSERLGFAVDSGAALVVDDLPGAPRARVVGTSHVVVVEVLEDGPPASRIHLLAAGDGYDVTARRAIPAEERQPLESAGEAPDLASPWQGDALHQALIDFAAGTAKSWKIGRGESALELRKADGYRVLGPRERLFAGPIEIR